MHLPHRSSASMLLRGMTGSWARSGASLLIIGLLLWFGTPAGAAIPDRITTTTLTLPANLEPALASWGTWETCSLSPRLYLAPLTDGRSLVGWTDGSLNGHVSVVRGPSITATFDFTARPVRGLVGHDDGSFAVLLWDRGAAGAADDIMWLSRRNASGVEQWSVRVTSLTNIPSEAADRLGDSRLAYGGGVYGCYLAVHAISGFATGHEGDEYTRVSDAGANIGGGWSWGLSHSMAQLVGWHPDSGGLTTVGVSDCYPGKGLYANASRVLWASDGDCAGMAQVQLGQMAPATNRRWLVVFNAISRPGFPSQGVGLARFGPSGSPVIAWLTNTTGTDERDPVIARIGSSLASNRLLTGWRTLSGDYRLAVIDTSGTLLEGPVTLDAATRWGNRDDSFRPRSQGSVSWLYGAAGSSTLRLYRYAEATTGINLTPAVRLYSAAPNPFNPRTTIRFDLPVAGQARLSIYDLAGRLVRVLVEGEVLAGSHEAVWDGRDSTGHSAPSGSYLARLVAGGKVEGVRLSLVR